MARITKSWLEENNITVLKWPAQFSDFNPIKNLWSEVNQHLRNNHEYIKSKEDLWQKLQIIWNNIKNEIYIKLIETMSERVGDVLSQKGGYTRW